MAATGSSLSALVTPPSLGLGSLVALRALRALLALIAAL
jgi:hypothetical protein